jgi:hypothetical protein
MEDSILSINKEMFVSIKKENINNYYEVAAKVCPLPCRSLERERMELYTKGESRAPRGPGELLKRSPRQPLRIPTCS